MTGHKAGWFLFPSLQRNQYATPIFNKLLICTEGGPESEMQS